MKIQWVVDCEIEIIENYNEDSDVIEDSTIETRKVGDIDEVDIVGFAASYNDGEWEEDHQRPQLQFGDGSVTLSVERSWFKIIED